jgi:hypothetical protein
MPASKKTAAMAPAADYGKAPRTPTARENARKAAKSTPAAKTARAQRGAPQSEEAYAASSWGTVVSFELTTPSGQKCRAHEMSIERLIEMGLLEAINSLSGIVEMETLPKGGPPAVDMAKLLANTDQLIEVMALVNVIVCEAVEAPKVHPVIDEDGNPVKRIDGLVYVDSIPMTDRFFLFGEVTGGLESLASFR